MSQQFQVLKCFKCSTFQVHQVKKSVKWVCKMCGEKQSMKRNYGTGTGKECRLHVQNLNSIRGEIAESLDSLDTLKFEQEDNENINAETCIPSKWAQYVEIEKEPEPKLPEGSASNFRGSEVVLELPKNVPKKRLNKITNNDNTKRLKPMNPDPNQRETHVLSNDNIHSKTAAKSFIDEIPRTSNLNYDKLTDNKSSVFEPHKRCKSKWAIFVTEHDEMEEVKSNISDAGKVYEEPKVAKDSKWSQYVENNNATVDKENEEFRVLKNVDSFDVDVNVKGISFSQCSDEDIDAVLDF